MMNVENNPRQIKVLAIIPARKGSRGVPGKNVRLLAGKPVIAYTIEAALAAERIDKTAVTSDDPAVEQICRQYPAAVFIERPAELAADTSRIDDVMRHGCRVLEKRQGYRPDLVVLLYANVPVRPEGIIDRAVEHLERTGADSVQTLTPSGKFHPYWQYTMEDGGDRITKFIDTPESRIYRRQNLPPAYLIDGAVGAVRYEVLMQSEGQDDPHAFWGHDRRGLRLEWGRTVDIDQEADFTTAEILLMLRNSNQKAE